ncbi:MAG: cation:proton antiporter [Rugosibacter sp.]|nr:cation:proton antiporter [Rugosibacter sp.]
MAAAIRFCAIASALSASTFCFGPSLPMFDTLPRIDASSLWLALVALLLLCGWVAGELAARIRLPRVIGYALAGGVFGLLDHSLPMIDLHGPARLLGEIGLGVLLFDLGRRVDFSRLKRDPTLALTAVAEMGATFVVCFGILRLLDVATPWAAVAAVIAMGTSPGVVISMVRDVRAQGQVTERLLWLTAANSTVAALMATLLAGWFHAGQASTPWHMVVVQPLYLVMGSLLLAALVASAISIVVWVIGKNRTRRLLLNLSAILFTLAVARALGLSVPLSLLALGLITHHQNRRDDRASEEFGEMALPLTVLFFVFVGTSLASVDWLRYGWPALVLVAARLSAKWLATGLVARLSGLTFGHSFRLGLGLTPMSGLSLMLVADMSRLYPGFASAMAGILVAAIALCGLLGPLVTHFALVQSGEAAPDEMTRPEAMHG